MASYKERVRDDLDRWIAGGLVAGDKRDEILATIPDARRLDAATTLAYVGAVLLGIAVITFISANWDGMPKLVRFAILLVGFLAMAGLGAWATHRQRPILSNIALLLAALVFAASIGLTGQIFDIAGNPKAAAYGAGLGAFALALAGRSTGAATVGLVFIALGDFEGRDWFNNGLHNDAPWMLVFGPFSAFLALRWGSAPLAHVSALAILYCFGWFAARTEGDAAVLLFLSIGMGAMAAGARWLYAQDRQFAGVFYGWFAGGALLLFAIAGYAQWGEGDSHTGGVLHRLVWLALSGGLMALGRYDRHALVTGIGVLSLIGAICALLTDLGLDLLAAAGVFGLCALAALVAGFLLRRKAQT